MISVAKYKKGDFIQHKTYSALKRQIIGIYFDKTKCCGYIEDIYYQTIIVGAEDIPPMQINEGAIDKYYIKIEKFL